MKNKTMFVLRNSFKTTVFLAAIVLYASLSYRQTRVMAQSDSRMQSATGEASETARLDYGLVIDCSISLRAQLPLMLDIGKTIVGGNRLNDKTFLVRFISTNKIETIVPLTNDKSEVIDGLENLYTESGLTAITDALRVSTQYLLAQQTANVDASQTHGKALILITDGEERTDKAKINEVLATLHEKKVRVYVIGLSAELKNDKGNKTYARAVKFLKSIADATDGRAFFPETREDFTKDTNELFRLMRQQ